MVRFHTPPVVSLILLPMASSAASAQTSGQMLRTHVIAPPERIGRRLARSQGEDRAADDY